MAMLNNKLSVSKVYFNAETRTMPEVESKDELTSGMAFAKTEIVFGLKT